MVKQPKRPRGRPSIEGEPMQQIAVRLSAELLAEVDAINDARRAAAGRTAVIRELLWEAIDKRRKASK
jgi:metal-responsive CopG/Arc/MetJ family transcriptional regulator